MSLSFTVIDFETANSSRSSACSVGAVKVKDGEIVDRFSSLIKPPAGHDEFMAGNVRIHGIRRQDVANAPEWPEVATLLAPFIGNDVLIAHNMQFDSSVLASMCGTYSMTAPKLETLCSLVLARETLKLPSYKLSEAVAYLGLEAFQHHDALEDSLACARLVLKIADLTSSSSFRELNQARRRPALNVERAEQVVPEVAPDDVLTSITEKPLEGRSVVFTGELDLLPKKAAQALLEAHGGIVQGTPTKKTALVVAGDFDRSLLRDGAMASSKLMKAFDLVKKGSEVKIITEQEFLGMLVLSRNEVVDWLVSSGMGRSGRGFIPGGSGVFSPHLPDHIVDQSKTLLDEGVEAWQWFDGSLMHPSGPASAEDGCIWCSKLVPVHAHRIHRERHVCGAACSRSVQLTAVRMWEQTNTKHADWYRIFWL